MKYKEWAELPEKMKRREIRRYYNIIQRKKGYLCIKRVFDVVASFILLVILLIPMVVIVVCIKLDSPGSVFFMQERVTQYGKIFKIYKFRTMVENAPSLGTQVTVGNDSRITKMGKILRKYRFDEFPQLINIFMGDMSFVGTRPEVIKYVKKYTPEMYATLLLPAGLTSWTSIAYKDEDKLLQNVDDADAVYINEILPAKMRYNLESIKRIGFIEDMSVLWNTFASVIKK